MGVAERSREGLINNRRGDVKAARHSALDPLGYCGLAMLSERIAQRAWEWCCTELLTKEIMSLSLSIQSNSSPA